MADANVSALQAQINRFYGVAIGAPISVDGVAGPQTAAALKSVMDYMQGAGGVSDVDIAAQEAALSSDGGNTLDTGLITSSASDLSGMLQSFADANNLTTGVTPAAGGGGGGSRGFVTSTFPKTSAAATDLVTTINNLPLWVKIGGGIVAALILFSIGSGWIKSRRRRALHGLLGFSQADVMKAAESRAKVSAKKRRRAELPILDVDFTEA
jgi:hypothetical protein